MDQGFKGFGDKANIQKGALKFYHFGKHCYKPYVKTILDAHGVHKINLLGILMLVKVHIIVSYITTWCCGPEDGGSVFL
jgi:hypothetical protein